MNNGLSEEQIAQALVDPASVFADPGAVLAHTQLTDPQKIEILKRWEYDARENHVADEEGFPARQPGSLLDTVLAALHELQSGPDTEHSPPTKQGGV